VRNAKPYRQDDHEKKVSKKAKKAARLAEREVLLNKAKLYEAMKALLGMNKDILFGSDSTFNKVEALKRLSRFVGDDL